METLGQLIFVGAEAEVRRSRFLGRPTVRKTRLPKAYRHPRLDEQVRRERTRAEALVLAGVNEAGVRVPRVLDVDLASAALELEEIPGPQLRTVLDADAAGAAALCRRFGRLAARLHAAGVVHGDLTTSNLIVQGDELVLIDFGLAQRSTELEDRGVDLHLVERTFESSHPGRPELFAAFCEGYAGDDGPGHAVLERMEEIKGRARYA